MLDVPQSSLSAVKKKELSGVTRSLESLKYPPEPEDTSVFDDPLKAEEVKPLRRQDYVNLGELSFAISKPLVRRGWSLYIIFSCYAIWYVAKSQELRRVLALPRPEDPPYARPTTHVRSILSGLAAIKDLRAREQYLAQCLGLEEELHRVRGGTQGNKRNQHQLSSTPGRGGRGGAHKGAAKSTATATSQDFYLPDYTASGESVSNTDSQGRQQNARPKGQRISKTTAKEGSSSMFIGAEEREAMRAFAEVVRQALEGNAGGTEGERGTKRKMEWDV